jgi:signal transduction histidine kinase/ActR/RegA family two-component response regulator
MKITQRLVVLFLIVSLSFAVLIYLFFQIKELEGKLYSQADALQRRQIINTFIEVNKNDFMRTVDDRAIDDEMVGYVRFRNQTWANQSLYRLIARNDFDLVQVYDTSGTAIYNAISGLAPELASFRMTSEFFEYLRNDKRKYFTEPWKQVHMQMGASTIHLAADSTRQGSFHGYLVLGKLWSVSNLNDFSTTLDYNIRFYDTEPSSKPISPFFNVNIAIPLQGWDNRPAAWLRFSSNNPFIEQWQSLGKQLLLGILAFTLVFLVLQFALLSSWIHAPLRLISNSLRTGNPELIEPLTRKRNEYGEIANLIKRFFEQNHQLRTEMEERRKTEIMLRQVQKMESIGTLAGGIAHDFNNIITIISGYVALASGKTKADSEVRTNLEEAMTACFRGKKLLEKILTFSRQTEKNVEPVNFRILVEETMELLSQTIPSSIAIKTDFKSHAYVLADPTEMQQVVMNIASNAYQSMRYQGGKLSISLKDVKGKDIVRMAHSADLNQKYVCLTVSDTGTGIPREIMDRIFDPYFSTKAPGEGTGLGLSIVHGIVTGIGGHIHIDSVLEHGTTFSIFLPATALRSVQQVTQADVLPFRHANIYFVDDEPALNVLFKETLTQAGYGVSTFDDGAKAYKSYTENSGDCDLLIADIAMPGMNGIQLAQKCRQINPDLPIILYSGYIDPTIQKTCRDLAINKFLVKPVLPETLEHTVREILAGQKPGLS